MTEKQYSDIEKLQMLIAHWLQHNESHSEEYGKWAAVARQDGHIATAQYLEQALDLLAKADQAFEKALESVGGAPPGHTSEHHRHHHHDD